MKISALLFFCTFLAVAALSQRQSLGTNDTLAAAKLSSKELSEVISAVQRSAFDTPRSWTDELHAKRVDLGGVPALVLQGTEMLCGATANCQIFVLCKFHGHWGSLFEGQRAPIGESFEFGPGVTLAIKDLTISTNFTAESVQRVTDKFDGRVYRPT